MNAALLEQGWQEHLQKIKDLEANRDLRDIAATRAFYYLCVLSSCVLAILLAHGFKFYGFQLDSAVLATLSGGTFVSAIGLFGIVVKGLFPVVPSSDGKARRIGGK